MPSMTSPAQTSWLLIAMLYVAGLLAAGQFAKVSLSLEPLGSSYPGAPVAFAVSAVAVMGLLFGVVAGGVISQMGLRRAVLAALLLSAIVSGLQAFLPSFPILIALRVIEGAGHLALVIAAPALMVQLAADKDKALVMGLWASFFGVGFAIGALVVSTSVTMTFGVHAGLLALMLVILTWRLPKDAAAAEERIPRAADHVSIYRRAVLSAPALSHGIYALIFLALVTFAPNALGAPWLGPVLPIVGILGSLIVGPLARWIRPGHMVSGGFAIMGLAFLIASFTWSLAPFLLLIGIAVSGIVTGAGFAAVPWLNERPTDRALAYGAMAQCGNIGTFAGTPLFAMFGEAMLLPMAAGLAFLAALATGIVYRNAARSAWA